ncbi:MAG TPA: DUF6612 family protein [Patescibacteria group bacterium]|nr:DUF6612 family protein [Patescibacteria group bacterium]
MKLKKPLLFFLLLHLLVLPVCVSAAPAAATDLKTLVTRSQSKMLALQNYHMTLQTTIASAVQGQDFRTLTTGEFDLQQKPLLVQGDLTVSVNFAGKAFNQSVSQYMEESGNQLTVYSKVNETWTRQQMPFKYNPVQDYQDYIGAIKSLAVKSETDQQLVLEVVATGDAIKERLARSFDSMNAFFPAGFKRPPDFFANIGDMAYTMTIDKKSGLVLEMNIDVSNLMSSVGVTLVESMETLPAEQKQVLAKIFTQMKMTTTISFSQFNTTDPVIIPEEARNPAP